MQIDWDELQHTVEFVSMGNEAVLCLKTGKFLWHSDLEEDLEEWPDDANDEQKYLVIPDKKELDLGKALVLEFARECLPGEFDEVQRIFSKRGAYAQFRNLLLRRNALDRWYNFENKATEKALREWCEANGLTIREADPDAPELEPK
jgi:hypothetical protein